MDETVIKHDVETFQESFNNYYNSLLNFINGGILPEKTLASADLNENTINLQAAFYTLPEIVQKRLLAIDFNLFLQADNEVDLYAYRNYILKHRDFMLHMFTVSIRADSEIKLILKLLGNHNYRNYKYAINRDYSFYEKNEDNENEDKIKQNLNVCQIDKSNNVSNSINTYFDFSKETQESPISSLLKIAIKLISKIWN
ncbi:hypothetical protein [Caproicibacter sp.]|uniref:hypothetical protein n=1 Tax=Caproicibacter sp. TaxID=2814884 RepID=UPI00398A0360